MKREKYSTGKQIWKFFSNVISWVILILLILIAAFLIYYLASTKYYEIKGLDYKPKISLFTIISPSMEPNINVYDIVVDVRVDDPYEINIGDVITFESTSSLTAGLIITHRVVGIVITEDGLEYTTKGDNNTSADSDSVPFENVIGKVTMRIPQLGRIQTILSNRAGWLFIIIIPAMIIIILDVLKLIRLNKANKKVIEHVENEEQIKDDLKNQQEEIVNRLKEKYKDNIINEHVEIEPSKEQKVEADSKELELPIVNKIEEKIEADIPTKNNYHINEEDKNETASKYNYHINEEIREEVRMKMNALKEYDYTENNLEQNKKENDSNNYVKIKENLKISEVVKEEISNEFENNLNKTEDENISLEKIENRVKEMTQSENTNQRRKRKRKKKNNSNQSENENNTEINLEDSQKKNNSDIDLPKLK